MSNNLLNTKSNEPCRKQIDTFETCKKTGTAGFKSPTACYEEARILKSCYENKSTKIDPLCLPIFNDVRECLFQTDSHIFSCKQELNELNQCFTDPANYIEFLKMSTEHQKKPKKYNTTLYYGKDDING